MNRFFDNVSLQKTFKEVGKHNPVMTQRFGADPWAMVYGDRVYLYMTHDVFTYDEQGNLSENVYSKIDTISVASSADLVNWTDHGLVAAAGKNGAAGWGGNSWAPAAAWKNIDGKDRFFLYFANSGNGIAVLSADSPTGPFTDPIGKALISRDTPTCADVTWLFDPAVLQDDDGNAYIYFGGGIPGPEHAANPGTARVARLADDMIHLVGDPIPIADVPWLFEDSGINKVGDRYIYSYCSNFDVTEEAAKEIGFDRGEIITMVSDKPMGPFKLDHGVLKNPEVFFGRGGNNHHCMFRFRDTWYIAYHSRILEEYMDLTGGYRSTNIDLLPVDETGAPAVAKGTREGVAQVQPFNPYETVSAATIGTMAGLETVPDDNAPAGTMLVQAKTAGCWLMVYGADFGDKGATAVILTLRGEGEGAVRIARDALQGDVVADVPFAAAEGFAEITVDLPEQLTGKHDLYFLFGGASVTMKNWRFV